MDVAIDDGLAVNEAAFARIALTHDALESVAAFLEEFQNFSDDSRIN